MYGVLCSSLGTGFYTDNVPDPIEVKSKSHHFDSNRIENPFIPR